MKAGKIPRAEYGMEQKNLKTLAAVLIGEAEYRNR